MDGLLIGRFQPFHLGHLHAVRYALSKADNVWIGIGSSDRSFERQNPFSSRERREMIESSLDEASLKRIGIYEIPDLNDHRRWAENIRTTVPKFDAVFTNDRVTSHIFSRQGTAVLSIPFEDRGSLSGTGIREKIISGGNWEDCVPDGTKSVLIRSGANDRLRGM